MKWLIYIIFTIVLVTWLVVSVSRSLVKDETMSELPHSAPPDMMMSGELQPAAKVGEQIQPAGKVEDLPFDLFMELR